MEVLETLSDEEIRQKLLQYGHPAGPVTSTTRKILICKLRELMKTHGKFNSRFSSGEESGCETGSRTRNMPPPSIRSRRTNKSKKNRSFDNSDSSSSRQISPVLFDSGSDSDCMENSFLRNSSYRGLSSYRSQIKKSPTKINPPIKTSSPVLPSTAFRREAKPFLSNLRRLTRLSNETSPLDINETDTSSCYTPLKFRESTSVRSIYDRTPDVEPSRLKTKVLSYLPMALLILFLLFLTWLGVTYFLRVSRQPPRLSVGGKPVNVYPICTADESHLGRCIPKERLNSVVTMYKDVHQALLARGVQSICGPVQQDGSYVSAYMSERQVVQFLLKIKRDTAHLEDMVKHLALLLIENPNWGISVTREPPDNICPIPENLSLIPSELASGLGFYLVTPCPHISWTCRLQLIIYSLFYYVAMLSIVPGVTLLTYLIVKHYRDQAKAIEEQVLQLVEQILNKLGELCGPKQEFVSIRHVHDILIPPADRPRMASLWEKAVTFIDKHESRVRRDVQIVWGEETAVWRLLAPPTIMSPSIPASPTSTMGPGDRERLYPDISGMGREVTRVWQGEAFGTSEGSMNSLPVSPTPCLKVRHMFQPNNLYGPDWETAVKDAIIEKCEGVRIIHISIEKHSKEGCVYLKCSSSQEAGVAYGRLHGSWFDGALVTVKYLRLERYHERFPDAIHAKTPLLPSNNLKLSLGGLNPLKT